MMEKQEESSSQYACLHFTDIKETGMPCSKMYSEHIVVKINVFE